MVGEALDTLQSELLGDDDDKRELELIRRQRVVFQHLQQRLHEIRRTGKQQAYSAVTAYANGAVEELSEISRSEDAEALLEAGLQQAAARIDQLYDGTEGEIREARDQAAADLDEIGESPLGQAVARLDRQCAQKAGVDMAASRPAGASAMPQFARAACTPLQKGLQAAAKDAKGLRDTVYKLGKTFGKKFRPHEAVKGGKWLAKAAGKLGKAVPVAAVALDFYIQYSEEKGKEQKERYLANLRISLRSAFAREAKVAADTLDAAVVESSSTPVLERLRDLDQQAEQVATARVGRTGIQNDIGVLKRRCAALREKLDGGQPGGTK